MVAKAEDSLASVAGADMVSGAWCLVCCKVPKECMLCSVVCLAIDKDIKHARNSGYTAPNFTDELKSKQKNDVRNEGGGMATDCVRAALGPAADDDVLEVVAVVFDVAPGRRGWPYEAAPRRLLLVAIGSLLFMSGRIRLKIRQRLGVGMEHWQPIVMYFS